MRHSPYSRELIGYEKHTETLRNPTKLSGNPKETFRKPSGTKSRIESRAETKVHRRLFLGGRTKKGNAGLVSFLSCFVVAFIVFTVFLSFLSFCVRFFSFPWNFQHQNYHCLIVLSFGKTAWIPEINFFNALLPFGIAAWIPGTSFASFGTAAWRPKIMVSSCGTGDHTCMISCSAGQDFLCKDMCPFVYHAACG